MLKITNLCARFEEKEILKGLNLNIKPGEIHVLLGPNGSGKSTLGRVILGDDKYEVTDGSIVFKGENLEALDPAQRAQKGFFLSFQSPPEIDGVSVRSFLFAAKKSIDPDFTSSFKFKKGLKSTFESLRLPEDFTERETNLGFSGGERKKMEVASLLALDPDLAFLDEIDSGVDIDTIRSIGRAIGNFMTPEKAIILVTHSDKLLQEITPTHVHIFMDGKIIKSGGKEMTAEIQTKGFDSYKPQREGLRVIK
ncbi:MAG TPA: Fe-S cluster assembly ATPase SufC [Candidatus Gracilibacteria bacterium]